MTTTVVGLRLIPPHSMVYTNQLFVLDECTSYQHPNSCTLAVGWALCTWSAYWKQRWNIAVLSVPSTQPRSFLPMEIQYLLVQKVVQHFEKDFLIMFELLSQSNSLNDIHIAFHALDHDKLNTRLQQSYTPVAPEIWRNQRLKAVSTPPFPEEKYLTKFRYLLPTKFLK